MNLLHFESIDGHGHHMSASTHPEKVIFACNTISEDDSPIVLDVLVAYGEGKDGITYRLWDLSDISHPVQTHEIYRSFQELLLEILNDESAKMPESLDIENDIYAENHDAPQVLVEDYNEEENYQ